MAPTPMRTAGEKSVPDRNKRRGTESNLQARQSRRQALAREAAASYAAYAPDQVRRQIRSEA